MYTMVSYMAYVLQDYIGEESLPSTYGGSQVALNSSIHPYQETIEKHF